MTVYILERFKGGIVYDTINLLAAKRAELAQMMENSKKQMDRVRAFYNIMPAFAMFTKEQVWYGALGGPEYAKESSAGRAIRDLVITGFLTKMPTGDVLFDGNLNYDKEYDYSVMGTCGVSVGRWRRRHPNDMLFIAEPGTPNYRHHGTWIGWKDGYGGVV